MEKEFIPYEQALALKEIGFDEHCFGRYGNDSKMLYKDYSKELHSNWHTIAPLWQQSFRWFRDKHNLNGYCYIPNETGYWAYSLENKAKYSTYEEAQLECLKKLIEIVKKL